MKPQPDKKYKKSVADFFFNLRVKKNKKVPKRTGKS